MSALRHLEFDALLNIYVTCLLQNLALNIADKGFSISVYNRTYAKTEAAVARAKKESRVLPLVLLCSCGAGRPIADHPGFARRARRQAARI